jgi:recombinational DNA repair protein (RecF pathway)
MLIFWLKRVKYLMQGIILNIVRVKDEDLIVTLLTKKRLKTLYRFYGARHSQINLGYKIDFIAVYSTKSTLPMLREVLHLGFPWQFEKDKVHIWQQFIKLLYKHLKDVDELDEFYFLLLEKIIRKLKKQNPKRVIIEAYLELLEFEGRLHDDFHCFICENFIEEKVVLKRSFLVAHDRCLIGKKFDKKMIKDLFKEKSTLLFDDEDVERLWEILQEGL